MLISHFHRDHFDLPSLRRLPRDAHLVVPAGAGRLAADRTREGHRARPRGRRPVFGSVTVTAVPAQHDGRREPLGPSLGAVGYVVSGRSSVYFAGDTDLFDRMGEIGPRLDVALLPVWGWGPTVGPGHLDPEGAARALALLHPRIAIPVHWGTLFPVGLSGCVRRPLREPPHLFAAHAARLAPDVEVRVLAPGESTMISRPGATAFGSERLSRARLNLDGAQGRAWVRHLPAGGRPHGAVIGMIQGQRRAPRTRAGGAVLPPVAHLEVSGSVGGRSSAAISRARRSASPGSPSQVISAAGRPANSPGAYPMIWLNRLFRVDDRRIRGPDETDTLRCAVEHERLQAQALLQPGVVGHVVPGQHEPAPAQRGGTHLHGPSELTRRPSGRS